MARAITTQKKVMWTALAWGFGLAIFFPILWTFLTSFKTEATAIADPPVWFLFDWTTENYTAVQERISVGALDMATQPAAAAADRRMQISSFPYLAETWAQAQKIYGPGGVVREVMNGLYAEQDITVLAAYPVYFGGIALNVENANPASTEPNGI